MAAPYDQGRDSTTPAKRNRALLVCLRCHGKKIKCDLAQQISNLDRRPCHNCTNAGATCELRPSKRGPGKRRLQLNGQIFAPGSSSVPGNQEGEAPSNVVNITSTTSNHTPVCDDPSAPSFDGTFPHHIAANSDASMPQISVPSFARTDNSAFQQRPSQATYIGETGYMQIFSQDNVADEEPVLLGRLPTDHANVDAISPALQGAFLETYSEYCFLWCPVLDYDHYRPESELVKSPLLRQALALCGNRINPPSIQYKDSSVYYNRAKELFYSNIEGDLLVRLASIMLFFWWSVGPINLSNMDNAWWWTGIAIRIAQEGGLHREPQPHELARAGLRRRIWWTLFARDRILSISQGRPTAIHLDACDVKMVTVQDFPDPSKPKVGIFINWVKLLEISGRINQQLSKKEGNRTSMIHLSQELISWVQAMPEALSLSIGSSRTMAFDRDVHRLYLTYLTNIILLHMSKSSELLPKASKAAIIAASCVARLLEDYLARGNIRFLTGDAGWEIAVALLALLHARRMEGMRDQVNADIQVLRTSLKQMAMHWPSSRMFASGFDRLLDSDRTFVYPVQTAIIGSIQGESDVELLDSNDGTEDWMRYFPFVTVQTSPLINSMLAHDQALSFPLDWPMDFNATLQEFFFMPEDRSFDAFNSS